MTIIYAILMFLILIFVHELGHFILAKLCGVKVNEFALGMGPVLIQRQKGETIYSLRAIPIGGFCAMEGEDEDSDDERAFGNKKPWQKILVLVAGATMNLLLCILIMTSIALFVGSPSTTVGYLQDDAPASTADIRIGDKLMMIDNNEITKWTDVSQFIGQNESDMVTIVIEREGESITKTLEPILAEDGRKIIGITPKVVHNPARSLYAGVLSTWEMAVTMVDVLGQLFSGSVSAEELTGPVGIVAVVNESVPLGFVYIAYLVALISLNLAIVNMLPFPALDGGRVLFVIIRAITGKAITDDIEGKIHFAGIMLLFLLMIYVTWNDIERFVFPLFN